MYSKQEKFANAGTDNRSSNFPVQSVTSFLLILLLNNLDGSYHIVNSLFRAIFLPIRNMKKLNLWLTAPKGATPVN